MLTWFYQLGSDEMGEKRTLCVCMKYCTGIFGNEVMKEKVKTLKLKTGKETLGEGMQSGSTSPASKALLLL